MWTTGRAEGSERPHPSSDLQGEKAAGQGFVVSNSLGSAQHCRHRGTALPELGGVPVGLLFAGPMLPDQGGSNLFYTRVSVQELILGERQAGTEDSGSEDDELSCREDPPSLFLKPPKLP